MKNVSGGGCSRATYRGAQVTHAQGGRGGGGVGWGGQAPASPLGCPLAVPGVTHAGINPQDAGSSVTVMGGRGEWTDLSPGPCDSSPFLPAAVLLTLSAASRPAGQIAGETRLRDGDGDAMETARETRNCCSEEFYNQPAAPPPPIPGFGPPSLAWQRPISTRNSTSLLLSILLLLLSSRPPVLTGLSHTSVL